MDPFEIVLQRLKTMQSQIPKIPGWVITYGSASQDTQNYQKQAMQLKTGMQVVLYTDEPRSFGSDPLRNPYYPDFDKGRDENDIAKPIVGVVEYAEDYPTGYKVVVKWETGSTNTYSSDLMLLSDWQKKFLKKPEPPKVNFKELDKVILAEDKRQSILSVLKQHQNSDKLFKKWGLGAVMEYGKGMTMLFWGPPGTGKTWACHCIAKSLGKKLTIMDNAKLQSSTPGQMERNLQEAFAKATQEDAILLFDECDSLLMSRSNVGMIIGSEINCLLTEVEKFEGILIMTTNRIEELDPALERRISLILQFPKPNAKHRKDIWKRFLPKKLPLAPDVNIDTLASFEHLTGGLIKNVVLNAARAAIGNDKEEVCMEDFARAIQLTETSKSAFERPSRAPRAMGIMKTMAE